ncbi:MAG: response regulator [Opitutales bacterium]
MGTAPHRASSPVPTPTRIFLGDDHGIIRDAVRLLLGRTPDLSLVGEAGNGRDLVAGVLRTQPDVVVTDLAMPELNGIDALRQLRARGYGGVVVVLSSHDERRQVAEALAAGASAYVHKDDTFESLLEAIRAARRGERWLSPRVAGTSAGTAAPALASVLTLREREVLQLLAEGHHTKAVADRLAVSGKAIEYHRLNLFAKLKAKSVVDLVRIAVKEGLVEL